MTELSARLRSSLRVVAPRELRGYVFDPEDLERRFVVELLVDEAPSSLAHADLYDQELIEKDIGDGCYGFAFAIPPSPMDAYAISVIVANTEICVGQTIALDEFDQASESKVTSNSVRWEGGLRFQGWIERDQSISRITADIDGELIAEATCHRWAPRFEGQVRAVRRVFDLFLPDRFADGRLRRVHVRDNDGEELHGSPCEFVAFADGLAAFLGKQGGIETETLRGDLYDKLIPQALPFDQFGDWVERFRRPVAASDPFPQVCVALIGEEELESSIENLEAQERCEWIASSLADPGGGLAFPRGQLEALLDGEGERYPFIALAKAGVLLQPTALSELAQALEDEPYAPFAYCDFRVRADDGVVWPLAFTAYDQARALEQGYAASFIVARRSYVKLALKAGAGDLFRIFSFVLDQLVSLEDGERKYAPPVHVPGFLATVRLPIGTVAAMQLKRSALQHFRALNVLASAESRDGKETPSIRLRRQLTSSSVSIILRASESDDQVEAALAMAAAAARDLDFEILLVTPPFSAVVEKLRSSRVRPMRLTGPFSLERCANAAIGATNGDFLVFLEAGYEAAASDWLKELLGRIQDPTVGAVGPVLLQPDETISIAGYALAYGSGAIPRFKDFAREDKGFGALLDVAHESSAICAKGMLTRRSLFRELNGFDTVTFRARFADVDYSLKVRAEGYQIVVAPDAALRAVKTIAARDDRGPAESGRFERDLANLRTRWGEVLANDPFYSPMLSLDTAPFTALAWPPRSFAPRPPDIRGPRRNPLQ